MSAISDITSPPGPQAYRGDLDSRVIFMAAVDRIVQSGSAAGLDVTVETFSEWVIESEPFGDTIPDPRSPGYPISSYIERKLFG